MSRPLILILGDQLTESLEVLTQAPDNAVIALCEVKAEGEYVPHHPQKILLILSAMRHFADTLRDKGYQVHYSALDDDDNRQDLIEEAERLADAYGCDDIRVTQPGEWRLFERIQRRGTRWRIHEDNRFFCSIEAFGEWLDGRRRFRMEDFYRQMRKRTGLLMEGDEPAGGQWNFDHDNRNPIKHGLQMPAPPKHRLDDTTLAVKSLVETHFDTHFGTLEHFNWSVTRRQALGDLKHFIAHALADFGTYQDAISDDEPLLFHSRLSAAMNIGLLSPQEVCEAAISAWRDGQAPINAVEGFVRQILGWREYVRGIYWQRMPGYKQENRLNARRGLPDFYWTAETDLRCVRRALEMTRDNAYAHHIQRLMVTGNFALLCGVSPAALCDWYLAVYADAFEWVELPNTLGMTLYADGGYLGSKPYCASGKYIDRMSDHCRQCRYDVKQVTGERACPFNSLYWHFLEKHRERLKGNQRMKLIYGSWDKMQDGKRQVILDQAEKFLGTLTFEAPYGKDDHASGYQRS
ncbi:cryptochrome/photolyase family protein [Salinicola rhizosphaerae]|uniref:Deoxyribodipyrimidine photo-lyase n=1 Tax=Salinicola rhizosphaerae TaxID=1443141 RepID=A0ABQ3DVL5_9GAMM|nr:cryptochrome/photolyase family protein [Salinicola rhizosphaerae]GHB16675.1 deoxyribodipyrimidine photo-lyase [Salinicola rhizosphaerae]